MQPSTTGPMDRPATVTAASVLLYLLAATAIVAAIGETAAGESISILPLRAAAAAGFILLSYFCGRGKKPARIIVWVFGASASCNSIIAVLTAVHLASRGFYATKPEWLLPLRTITEVIDFTGIIAASILLALPASRPFFRTPSTPQPLAAPQPTPEETEIGAQHAGQ